MPYVSSAPLVKEYILDKTDKLFKVEGEPTTIKVRQARMGEKRLRDDLYKKMERRYEGDSVIVSQDVSLDAVLRKEVFLTLAGSNIIAEDGKSSMFVFDGDRLKNENEFNMAWARLIPSVADEILEKVLDMNPMWDFRLGEILSKQD